MLLDADGAALLTDFGLALDTAEQVPGARVGTIDYLAPEASICIDKFIPLELEPPVPRQLHANDTNELVCKRHCTICTAIPDAAFQLQ